MGCLRITYDQKPELRVVYAKKGVTFKEEGEKAAATASGDLLVNAFNAGSDYTQALQDFAVEFIGNLAGGGLADLTAKCGSKTVAKELSKMSFDYGSVNRMLDNVVKVKKNG